MKYHIDTIPVWDAFHEKSECPICILKKKSEESYVDSFLGGSVMEPATRVEVNKKGFCGHHNKLLYKAQKRLSLALMTHTYTMETIETMKKPMKKLNQATGQKRLSIRPKNDELAEFVNWIENKTKQCVICDRINQAIDRYAYTITYMWSHEDNFRKEFNESKGFCLPHMGQMLDMSSKELRGSKQQDFVKELIELQRKNLDRLEEEIKWFTLKFDYKNQDKPWGNSKDALPRLLQKLTGDYME